MTLHISESEVRAVLTMPMAVQAVEEISRKQTSGEVITSTYLYNNFNWLGDISLQSSTSGITGEYKYNYDNNGNPLVEGYLPQGQVNSNVVITNYRCYPSYAEHG